MKYCYNLAVRVYGVAILTACLFNGKARRWKRGRKGIFAALEKTFGGGKEPVAWFHCASLGEFEQGRPVIEAFRKNKPGYKILITFFSPSGYEVRKDYTGADFVFYLPLDTPANARRFVETVHPEIALFIKYEFWFNYLHTLQEKKVPVYLISAVFRSNSYFFKSYASWFRKQLHGYRKIFVQDTHSEHLLNGAGITCTEVAGDTRFDRVAAIAAAAQADPKVEKFKGDGRLWICGSTWEADEKMIAAVFSQLTAREEKIRLLIVPHEISEDRINGLLSAFPGAIRYSQADEADSFSSAIMIVDAVGLLSSLYRYGNVTYVGGGFGKGIHNLPEAAVFGIPVLFGPNHRRFIEAGELIVRGGGFAVSGADEMFRVLSLLLNDKVYLERSGKAAREYILSSQGATEKVMMAIAAGRAPHNAVR